MIFGYTRFLEEQVRQLNGRVESLEKRNQELVLALVTRTPLPEAKAAPKHTMSKGETQAKCTCGWHVVTDDPVKLQQEITNHYKSYAAAGGRQNWATSRAKLEANGEKDADV